ncbi:MAG: acyl-CoA dehydrogenase family protein, partial [Methylocystaceae bacterium]
MDFSLTKEEAMIQSMAREFAEKYVAPIADQIERENHLPDEIVEGMAELDLFGLPFDPKYGGTGAGYLAYVLALEQLSKISTSLQTV